LQVRERELKSSRREHEVEIHRLHGRERDLQAEIEAMKATWAWRLHERLQSLRGSGD
jgi:hypothetical protein